MRVFRGFPQGGIQSSGRVIPLCCPFAMRLCRNSKKRLICACHAGLDPASSSVKLKKTMDSGSSPE
jgi:hypothetical protein